MKPIAEYRTRVQVIIRLQNDDFNKLKIKLQADQLSSQKVMEKLILEYLRDNKVIMKLLSTLDNKRSPRKNMVSESEQRKISEQIERESPLQDLVICENPE